MYWTSLIPPAFQQVMKRKSWVEPGDEAIVLGTGPELQKWQSCEAFVSIAFYSRKTSVQ